MVHGFYRNNLYYQVENCADENEKLKFLFQAIKQNPVGRVLVYCGTRKTTEEIAFQLNSHFEDVAYYHAGMNTADRTQVQKGFETGKYRILVATNAFGMGIDRPDVRLVVHNQLPANIDSLYQEMGRAGRDGEFSTCLLLYAKKDKGLQSFFIQSSDAPAKIKSARFNNLDILIDYAEGSECRHAEILTYYRDSQRIGRCGHCDNCDPTSHLKVQKPSDIFETESTLASTPEKLQLTRSPKKKKSSAAIILNPLEETRFQSLRTWRKGKALELDLPAFVIFSDRTLRELAQKNPQSLEELKSIHGIGEQKLEKFGWDLLAELAN
jgi:ATP-dependent DNA helicase RecQ